MSMELDVFAKRKNEDFDYEHQLAIFYMLSFPLYEMKTELGLEFDSPTILTLDKVKEMKSFVVSKQKELNEQLKEMKSDKRYYQKEIIPVIEGKSKEENLDIDYIVSVLNYYIQDVKSVKEDIDTLNSLSGQFDLLMQTIDDADNKKEFDFYYILG